MVLRARRISGGLVAGRRRAGDVGGGRGAWCRTPPRRDERDLPRSDPTAGRIRPLPRLARWRRARETAQPKIRSRPEGRCEYPRTANGPWLRIAGYTGDTAVWSAIGGAPLLQDVEWHVIMFGGRFEVRADVLARDGDGAAESLGSGECLGHGGRERMPLAAVAVLK